MTKKFDRQTNPVYDEDGEFLGVNYRFPNAAYLEIVDGDQTHLRINIRNYWFGVPHLERLIAELIYIKEDLANHPRNLEAQQAVDMEEIEEEIEEFPEDHLGEVVRRAARAGEPMF